MKCDHVVKVAVLKKPDTIFSSIPCRMNPLVLVKSHILLSNLDNNRVINKLNKYVKSRGSGGWGLEGSFKNTHTALLRSNLNFKLIAIWPSLQHMFQKEIKNIYNIKW